MPEEGYVVEVYFTYIFFDDAQKKSLEPLAS